MSSPTKRVRQEPQISQIPSNLSFKYLVTSDTTLDADKMATTYYNRWNVEPSHQSLQQNASWEKSPTHTVTTRPTHFFAALCGYVKLERLEGDATLDRFAFTSKLDVRAIHSHGRLRRLNPAHARCIR
jgi:hypothetical protein